MESILAGIGLCVIVIIILYAIKKIDDYFYYKKTISLGKNEMSAADEKVYKAARAFALGVPLNEIEGILLECINFDEEDIEEVIESAYPHKSDEDGGYNAFVKAVNTVLGVDVY